MNQALFNLSAPYLVELEAIQANPYQTRDGLDQVYIGELARDIAARGLLEVPRGRLVDGDGKPAGLSQYRSLDAATKAGCRVQLAFGHNRLAAYRQLAEADPETWGLMPVNLVDLEDPEMAIQAWAENAKRRDLTPIEEAKAIQRMIEAFSWSQTEIGEKLGLDRSTVSNKLRLLRLPEEVQNAEMTERQLAAVVSYADLPEKVVQQAEKNWNGSGTRPSELPAKAKNMTSDQIREQVTRVIKSGTVELSTAPFKMNDVLEGPEMVWPSCEGCHERIHHGASYYCADKKCFEARKAAAIGAYLAEASKASGIQPVTEKLEWNQYDSSFWRDEEKELFKSGCPNLRIRFEDSSYLRNAVDGFPKAAIICLHNGQQCTCKKRLDLERSQAEAKKVEEAKNQVENILVQGVNAVKSALEAKDPGVNKLVLLAIDKDFERKTKGLDEDQVEMELAQQLIRKTWYGYEPEKAKAHVAGLLKGSGLSGYWEEDQAEKMAKKADRDYQRIRTWLEKVDTSNPPKQEAIRGNIANLEKLVAISGISDKLKTDIGGTILTLKGMVWPPDIEPAAAPVQPASEARDEVGLEPALSNLRAIPLWARFALQESRDWIRNSVQDRRYPDDIADQRGAMNDLVNRLEEEDTDGKYWTEFSTIVADTSTVLHEMQIAVVEEVGFAYPNQEDFGKLFSLFPFTDTFQALLQKMMHPELHYALAIMRIVCPGDGARLAAIQRRLDALERQSFVNAWQPAKVEA